jgi:hypothetical protein
LSEQEEAVILMIALPCSTNESRHEKEPTFKQIVYIAIKIVEHGHSSASQGNLDGIFLPCKKSTPTPSTYTFFGLLFLAFNLLLSGRELFLAAIENC